MGHKKASCKNKEVDSVASAAMSSLGGAASGSGKCTKCGNQARAGLTLCSPCAKQSSAPVGMNPVNAASQSSSTQGAAHRAPSFAEAAASNKQEFNEWTVVGRGGRHLATQSRAIAQQQLEEAKRIRLMQESDVLDEIERFSTPHRRSLAKIALEHGTSVAYLRAALGDKKMCMLGSACGGSVDGCFRRHSLPSNPAASGAAVSAGNTGGSNASSSRAPTADDSAGGDNDYRTHSNGVRGGRGGRGGGRAGPSSGHGGERNSGAQPGGASAFSSASAPVAAPTAATIASAATAAPMESRLSTVESMLVQIMSRLDTMAASNAAAAAAASSAAASAAASGAQQNATGSQ
jgi:hypothetical protein